MARNSIVAAGIAALALLAGTAQAGSDNRGEFELDLSTEKPGVATGLTFHVGYRNPSDPNAKPPAITSATFDLPAGTRINGSAVASCHASDEDLRAGGRGACPDQSRVGGGTLLAITGFGPPVDPVEADIVVFNGGDELVEVVFAKDTDTVLGTDRLAVRGATLVAHPPATPGGPPDGQTTIRRIELELPARSGEDGRPFVTAPPFCPQGRRWRSEAHFEFADGGRTSLASEAPCAREAQTRRRGSARLSVRPRRVRAFRRLRYRFVARGACGRHAMLRFARRHRRTNRHGRASMVLRLGRTGRRRVTLHKRGCETAVTFVRVLRRR